MSDQQEIEYVTKVIGTGAPTKPMLYILSVKELIDSVCPNMKGVIINNA